MKNFEWRTTTRQQRTIRNSSLRKKKNPLLLKLKTPRILQVAHHQSASFAKKNISQMSADTYKQNVTTAILLAILPSFVRKSHLQGLARLKTLLRVLEASFRMSINHYIYRLHVALSQAKLLVIYWESDHWFLSHRSFFHKSCILFHLWRISSWVPNRFWGNTYSI